MAWVQGKVTAIQSNGTTATLTFNSAIGSGNTVVGAVMSTGASSNVPTVADDKGNNYPLLDNASSNGTLFTFALGKIPAGGPITLTTTWGTAVGFPQMIADEYALVTGVDGTAHAMLLNVAPGTTMDAITSGNVTVSGADIVWGVMANTVNGALTTSVGTGFTLREQDTVSGNYTLTTEDKTVSGGSTAATFTDSAGNSHYISGVVALSPSAPVGPPSIDSLGGQFFRVNPIRYF